jgi:hypothetical protein
LQGIEKDWGKGSEKIAADNGSFKWFRRSYFFRCGRRDVWETWQSIPSLHSI